MSEMYRQGDVFLVRVDAIPENGTMEPLDNRGRVILAEGEVTGHAHATSPDCAQLFATTSGRFLKVTKTAALTHEEHGQINIPVGDWKVGIQKEYTPEMPRNVAD